MDLTNLFSRKDRWTRGLFLSFDISPISFLEGELLSKIIIDENLTVVLDQANWRRILYEDEYGPIRAGVHYNLESMSVNHGGRFHPKLYLLEQDNEIQISLGSFNLTQSGFKRNLESGLVFRIERANWDEGDRRLLWQIGDFLQQAFIEQNDLLSTSSPSLSSAVSELLSSPLFREAEQGIKSDKSPQFLHSLTQGLLGQIVDHVGDVTQLEIISPYFDKALESLKELSKRCRQISINVPHRNSTFPLNEFLEDSELVKQIEIHALTCEKFKIHRFIHAKHYRFHTDNGAWDFVTSANASSAGLMTDQYPRNVEVGLLYPAADKEFVPDCTVRSKVESIADLAPATADPFDLVTRFPDERPSVITSSRYIEGEIRIVLNSEIQQKSVQVCMLVNHSNLGEVRAYRENDEYKFVPELELSGQDLVQVKVRTESNKAWSLPVFVSRPKHDPHFLPTLGASAYEKCLAIGSFDGLEEAFRLAAESGREDWLMYLLDHWNLSRILEGRHDDDEDEDEEDLDVHVPSQHEGKRKEYEYRHLRKNMDIVFLGTLDFFKSFTDYVSSVIGESHGDMNRTLKFCMPVFMEISRKFFEVLGREERKKEADKEDMLRFPQYTWLQNFNRYASFGIYISNVLMRLAKSHPEDVDLRNQIWPWLVLHTPKTQVRLGPPFKNLVTFIRKK